MVFFLFGSDYEMVFEKINPLEIEKESMKIIENEMRHSFLFSPEEKLIVRLLTLTMN